MSELTNKSHEAAARAAIDAWAYALHPGLSGDKRAHIVGHAMQVVRDEVQEARTNPNLRRPPDPKPRNLDPDPTLPAGRFAQAVIRHAADTNAYGQSVDEHVARSAVAHGRTTCHGKVPVAATEADLLDLRHILNSPEGKRFRGVLAVASPEWATLMAQWSKVDASIELGEMSAAASHAGFARAEAAPKKATTKRPAPKKAAKKKPQVPAKKGR